jgi:hypothetical protein
VDYQSGSKQPHSKGSADLALLSGRNDDQRLAFITVFTQPLERLRRFEFSRGFSTLVFTQIFSFADAIFGRVATA